MTAPRFSLVVLVALLCLPAATLAQELSEQATESNKPCKYPTELLWHNERGDDRFRMGVSVLNENQQQVPNLKKEYFKVFLDDQQVDPKVVEVEQSKSVFTEAASEGAPEASAKQGVDPVHYDLYFSFDLTASMADVIELKGKTFSKANIAADKIHKLFVKKKLFGKDDRVYISGFTSQLQRDFMLDAEGADLGLSKNRETLRDGLLKVVTFDPQGSDAALYRAMDFNLKLIRDGAADYTGENERRQAVLIVITDSFNGLDIDTDGGRVKSCRNNKRLTDRVRESVLATSEATKGNFKLFLLALGERGETGTYKLNGKLSKKCKIRKAQQEVVDTRSFAAIASDLQELVFVAHPNPLQVLGVLETQFEHLSQAYEISYKPPAGVSRPKKFRVEVEIGDYKCADETETASGFIRSAESTSKHSPEEIAMLLGALIFSFFFIPRSLSNMLALLSGGSGGAARAEPRKKRRRKIPSQFGHPGRQAAS